MISVRRFRTKKASRSKKYKQLVMSTEGMAISIKEISFRKVTSQRPVKVKKPRIKYGASWRDPVFTSLVLIVLGLSGVIYFGGRIYIGNKLEPAKTFASAIPIKTLASQALPRSIPTHLSVPSVGIDTDIISVGEDSTGSIQMPPLFDWVTGWYQYSPTPGEIGPSIIVGHVDTYKGISVFWRLRDVKQGDIINITRADGRVVKFKVAALKQFQQSDFPTKEVYGNIKYPGLRLITCGGAFNTSTASYSQNTVVYAFMVS